jgi:hypothetical protein
MRRMADELDRDLAGLFRPVTPPPGGLAAAKRQGERRRRQRRLVMSAAAATAVVGLIAGLATGPLGSGATQHTDVRVGSGAANALGDPGSSVAPATNASAGSTTVATIPATATAEPTTFVAELSSEHVAVIDSQTGQVIRRLTSGTHDIFGTLSADGQTFYLQTPAGLESNCPSGFCAIDVATGATTPVARFDWGRGKPSSVGTPISPDGTHAVSTNFPANSAPTVTVATAAGPPVTYQIPSGYQVYADPLWSPNGQYLGVANVPGMAGQHASAPVIMDVSTGALTILEPPSGCSIEPMALSDTEVFADEDCPTTGADLIARYVLATGAAETSISSPPGATSLIAVATDAQGQHLIVAATEPGGGDSGRVWTEQGGSWTEVPEVEASALAW